MERDFNVIWVRIKRYEGEVFTQIRGGQFCYSVEGNANVPDRTNQVISKNQFEEVSTLLPLGDTVLVQHLRGLSYICAVLMDPRIRELNW